MRIESLRRGIARKTSFPQIERPAQEPARAAGIHNQSRSNVHRLSAPLAQKLRTGAICPFDGMQFRLIEILRAAGDGFL